MASTDTQAPANCSWWSHDCETRNPPEDREFLVALSDKGHKTFIGSAGLVGAVTDNRTVYAIHRGRGERWELSFYDGDTEILNAFVTNLPKQSPSVSAWLNGESIEQAEALLVQLKRKSNKN